MVNALLTLVYNVDMVYNVDIVYTVDMVYTVHMVYTVDMFYTVNMVYTQRWNLPQLELHRKNSFDYFFTISGAYPCLMGSI